MNDRWTHSICAMCWNARDRFHNASTDPTGGDLERCCYCGNLHDSCLYIRQDPAAVACQGQHGGES